MTIHLIKLCVGADSIGDLAEWQERRRAERRTHGERDETFHVTRQMPRRAHELLSGGSLYWVIKGQVCVRQRLYELRPIIRDDIPHCALVLDPKLVPVERRFHRPFQGWRYLNSEDAPPDLTRSRGNALPDSLRAELVTLGLL